ncbi:TetR/AcrR family transcriptional regulator [Glycomyces salinus]|uniref:TetR/AcrR family transcriptional regulator n=1 Tax=Glycomyces salinus TaxID=980294 RepID=UPI0018EAC823|nr:TetR/AcrR family transcriptional regulator [Glycomyces salinus]
MPEPRPKRADAVKNRGRILDAANRQIIVRGPEVPMEVIAADAGVAVGTLYRHFPTKNELVAAVLDEHFRGMIEGAEAAVAHVEAGADPYGELTAFARMVMETAASNHAVKAAARALGAYDEKEEDRERGLRAMNRLLEAGKATGDLRSDLTVDDFFLFFMTVPIEQPAPVRDRWFELMMDGFCATGARGNTAAPPFRK